MKIEATYDDVYAHARPLGLIVLKTDETVEPEFHHYFADHPAPLFVSRIQNADSVTVETLSAMKADMTQSAAMLPNQSYPVVGYACTSASSVIGSDAVEARVKKGCRTDHVTNPLRAAIACAADRGVSKFALVSPYIEDVNTPLRDAFSAAGLSTDVFGSFEEGHDPDVVRISVQSVVDAGVKLGSDTSVDAVFLSCTNLRTREAIPLIEAEIKKPVLSSNQALAWHMKALSGEMSKVGHIVK
ncbi:MAG: Asp/Glu racemase [Pseudomonadota bacterium]